MIKIFYSIGIDSQDEKAKCCNESILESFIWDIVILVITHRKLRFEKLLENKQYIHITHFIQYQKIFK